MAITSLLWNNGWSSQLSLSLDPPPSSDALCYAPSGGLLMEKKPFWHFRNAVEGLWLYSVQFNVT